MTDYGPRSDDVITTTPQLQGGCGLLIITTKGNYVYIEYSHSLSMPPTGPPNVDKHLKAVRAATWEMRTQWYNLGLGLGINVGTLKVSSFTLGSPVSAVVGASTARHDSVVPHHQTIECDYSKVDDCFTRLLEKWLITKPEWTALIEALKSPTVGHQDIARNVEALKSHTAGREDIASRQQLIVKISLRPLRLGL